MQKSIAGPHQSPILGKDRTEGKNRLPVIALAPSRLFSLSTEVLGFLGSFGIRQENLGSLLFSPGLLHQPPIAPPG
jgi:hypothetical protein